MRARPRLRQPPFMYIVGEMLVHTEIATVDVKAVDASSSSCNSLATGRAHQATTASEERLVSSSDSFAVRPRPRSHGQTVFSLSHSLRDRSARYLAVESAERGVVRMTHVARRTSSATCSNRNLY
ncbi:hypothetical protein BKA58DRAFT_401009 [Alternaria rosae]|uniref:uncharacterized protein n=1 Tax=Alternaria rosae TaxID=1187941 RepID=UPI001E8CBBAF|nr:uncharacterized protein BKA58DRAFT_401009 [Alternaria rosae]KAH6872821.1 hypothetical protein BKA58DRAFT_401009 [Alternaria rosae]